MCIRDSVISVTLVLVVVFLPIIFTNSLVSDILCQFCGVIVISTPMSETGLMCGNQAL